MSKTPSLESLVYRAKNTISEKMGVMNPAIDAIAAAIAGVNYGQYAYQDYLFRQLSPETADEEWLYLWANRLKVDRLSLIFATGTIQFLLTESVVLIHKGVIVKTADNVEYEVTAETFSDQPIPVKAMESGEVGNVPAGTNLYLVTAVTGLNPDRISSYGIGGGAELEDVEHWRDRVVISFNEKQIVGRLKDYVFWAKSAHPKVDLAWGIDNTPELGNVTVYIGQRQNDPLLSNEIKEQVQNYIDGERLAGCHVFVQQPTLKKVPVSISNVSNIETRTQIKEALQQYMNARLGSRSTLLPNELSQVISAITGEFVLLYPLSPISLMDNELHGLGAVTWL